LGLGEDLSADDIWKYPNTTFLSCYFNIFLKRLRWVRLMETTIGPIVFLPRNILDGWREVL